MNIKDALKAVIKRADPVLSKLRGYGRLTGAEKRRSAQLLLNIVIIVLINLVGLTMNFRCDLTRNHTYSLSAKSKAIVSNLKENLKIKVLFSKDLPAQHSAIYRYLKDLLEEYSYYANEYFSYEVIDDKDLEKAASDYGIRPVQSQEYENDQVKVRRTYMGLVIQQSDVVEKIEAITEPTGLEYNITSTIEKMSGKIDGLLRLKEPIRVFLYMDSSLAALPIDGIETLKDKVRDAVEKCNAGNYDKLRFEYVDPSADKNAPISADLYGVPKLKWKAGQDRFGKFIPAGEAYFGIVLKLHKKAELIDLNIAPTIMGRNVITGIDKLEDSINKAVGNMVSANPRIGYLTGHGEVELNDQQSPQGGAILRQVLSDVYDVQPVDLSQGDIPADLGLIIVNGPRKAYTEQEAYKIDQFLMKGKGAIFFLDSFTEVSLGQQNPMMQQPITVPVETGLDQMLRSYGVIINKNIILDTSCAKGNVSGTVRDFYHVPIIRKSGFNQESVISKYLKGLAMIKVSSVDVDEATAKRLKLARSTLVSSSDESWQMTGQINLNPFMMAPPQNKGEMHRYGMAVLVEGAFDSFFKGRAVPEPAEKDGKNAAPETITVQKLEGTVPSGKTRIIVVGSSEITRSYFLMNAKRIMSSVLADPNDQDRIFANGFFIHSMADYLLGNVYIPEMSSKSLDYNPLDKTSDGTKIALKAVNIAGVPLLVILAGLLIWKRRSQRKKSIQERFSQEARNE